MSSPAAIRIVSPDQFDRGTEQTPGSERRAAIAPALGIPSALWGGVFEVEPGARTGESIAHAKAGDFIHVPALLAHREINLSKLEPFRWLVVRSTPTPIVINLPDDTWP
jgi:uncharacterized RmlC-like cupin family protein